MDAMGLFIPELVLLVELLKTTVASATPPAEVDDEEEGAFAAKDRDGDRLR
jgi:hypothetical protein